MLARPVSISRASKHAPWAPTSCVKRTRAERYTNWARSPESLLPCVSGNHPLLFFSKSINFLSLFILSRRISLLWKEGLFCIEGSAILDSGCISLQLKNSYGQHLPGRTIGRATPRLPGRTSTRATPSLRQFLPHHAQCFPAITSH